MGKENEELGREVSLTKVLRHAESRCASFRALERIVKGDHFYAVWAIWDTETRTRAMDLIEKGDIDELRTMITIEPELGEMSLRQLREKAKSVGMSRYSRADREALIKHLEGRVTK